MWKFICVTHHPVHRNWCDGNFVSGTRNCFHLMMLWTRSGNLENHSTKLCRIRFSIHVEISGFSTWDPISKVMWHTILTTKIDVTVICRGDIFVMPKFVYRGRHVIAFVWCQKFFEISWYTFCISPVDWSLLHGFECPQSVVKVEQKHVLRIPEGNSHEAHACYHVSLAALTLTSIHLLAKLSTWGNASAWIRNPYTNWIGNPQIRQVSLFHLRSDSLETCQIPEIPIQNE